MPRTGFGDGSCDGQLTRRKRTLYVSPVAQVAELVDALVSGTSGASREGSSPFLGTICSRKWFQILNFPDSWRAMGCTRRADFTATRSGPPPSLDRQFAGP